MTYPYLEIADIMSRLISRQFPCEWRNGDTDIGAIAAMFRERGCQLVAVLYKGTSLLLLLDDHPEKTFRGIVISSLSAKDANQLVVDSVSDVTRRTLQRNPELKIVPTPKIIALTGLTTDHPERHVNPTSLRVASQYT